MKLTRFLTISFLLSLILFSCNKEERNGIVQEGDNNVLISKLGYKFSEDPLTKSGNKEKTIGVATVDIDDNYILVAELINAGNIELQETKATENQAVTDLTVVTFYDQEAKGAPRIQKDITTEFEIPGEGKCTALFLGNVSNEFTLQDGTNGTSGSVTRDGGKANSVNSGANLCWYSMEFSNPIPDGYKIELNSMIPLFAQISTIAIKQKTNNATVDGSTSGGVSAVDAEWPIESVTNAKLVEGIQATSGEISFNKQSVSYAKTTTDTRETLNVDGIINTTGASVSIDKNVIPNSNNFALSADIKLKGQTSSKTAKFVYNSPLSCGNRYAIVLSVRKKGIRVRYVVNTQMKGIYNKKFDDTQNAKNSTAKLGKNGIYYYKYGDQITLPTAPIREKYDNFDPMHVLRFDGWYTDQACTEANKYNVTTITLTVDNFESLKTSDSVNIYAFFNPIWYFYDTDKPTYLGGTARNYSDYSGAIGSQVTLTSTRFNKLPSLDELQKYFDSFIFHDYGYTDDKQDGYWFCKWEKIDSYKPYISSVSKRVNVLNNANFGVIDGVTFNKDDFFFVPALGARNSSDRAYDAGDAYLPHKTAFLANRNGSVWSFHGTINDVGANYGCMSGDVIFMNPNDPRFYHGLGTATICYWPDPTYSSGGIFDK